MMIFWLDALLILWVIFLFFGGRSKSEGENWRQGTIFSVITICITLMMVWGNFR